MRVYPGKIQTLTPFVTVLVTSDTTVTDLVHDAVEQFGLENSQPDFYRLSEVSLDRGGKFSHTNHNFLLSSSNFVFKYL